MINRDELHRRMQRMVVRVTRRDDYGTLLASGQVIRDLDEVSDPTSWRADLRRQARADRIRVRTGVTDRIVWALLSEAGKTEARHTEATRYMHALSPVVREAQRQRHQPSVVLRDGNEALFQCERCEAFGYLDSSTDDLVFGGDLFEIECPHDGPPKVTALTFFS